MVKPFASDWALPCRRDRVVFVREFLRPARAAPIHRDDPCTPDEIKTSAQVQDAYLGGVQGEPA